MFLLTFYVKDQASNDHPGSQNSGSIPASNMSVTQQPEEQGCQVNSSSHQQLTNFVNSAILSGGGTQNNTTFAGGKSSVEIQSKDVS